MVYIALIVIFACLVLSLYCTKNDLFSPAVLTCLVWLVCLGLYVSLPHQLYPLTYIFPTAIAIWILGFTSFALIGNLLTPRHLHSADASLLVRDLFIVLSAVSIVGLYKWAFTAITQHSDLSWGYVLRYAALGQKGLAVAGYERGYGGLQVYLWEASYLLELFYFSKRKWYRLLIPAFSFLSLAVLMMAKSTMLYFVGMTLAMLLLRYRVKIKYLWWTLALFLLMVILLQVQRTQFEGVNSLLELYLLSPMVAFERVQPLGGAHVLENIGTFVYFVLYRLHLSNIEPLSAVLPFIQVPIDTNTYTCLYPFYRDLGMWGIFPFAILLGFLAGYLHKRAICREPISTIMYAYFTGYMCMMFANEIFFTNMIQHIYVLIFVLVAFVLRVPRRNTEQKNE